MYKKVHAKVLSLVLTRFDGLSRIHLDRCKKRMTKTRQKCGCTEKLTNKQTRQGVALVGRSKP